MSGYLIADRVGAVVEGDEVYVARLPCGPILELRGTAALIWTAALDDSQETVADRVAVAVGAPAAEITPDVAAFIETLVEQGLIVPAAERY